MPDGGHLRLVQWHRYPAGRALRHRPLEAPVRGNPSYTARHSSPACRARCGGCRRFRCRGHACALQIRYRYYPYRLRVCDCSRYCGWHLHRARYESAGCSSSGRASFAASVPYRPYARRLQAHRRRMHLSAPSPDEECPDHSSHLLRRCLAAAIPGLMRPLKTAAEDFRGLRLHLLHHFPIPLPPGHKRTAQTARSPPEAAFAPVSDPRGRGYVFFSYIEILS